MIDLIPTHLRTTDVCSLLATMQRSGDYSAWRLLRDAMLDAGAREESPDLAGVYKLAVMLEPENDEWRLEWARCVGGERGEFVECQVELAALEPTRFADCDACEGHDDENPDWPLAHADDCPHAVLHSRIEKVWYKPAKGFRPPIAESYWNYTIGRHIGIPTRPDMVVSRGFVSSVCCSWADFLTHEPNLLWWPGATDVCVKCRGLGWCMACGYDAGRIPRPLRESHQPIARVMLTTLDGQEPIDEATLFFTMEHGGQEYRFDRWLTIPPITQGGRIVRLNSWHCAAFGPQVVFEMPE